MSALIIFLLTALISFAGSIHIGPVNLVVIRTSLQNEYKSALLVGLGGSLPELLYAAIAVYSLSLLKQHPEMLVSLNKLVIPFFLALAVYYFIPKKKKPQGIRSNHGKSFLNGLFLALFNPQLLPFWFATLLYMDSFLSIQSIPQHVAFIIGTSFGAFSLLSLYAWLAHYHKRVINQWLFRYDLDKIMGVTFLVMAVIKIIF